MRTLIERQYDCEIRQWGEYDGETCVFSAVQRGHLIVAESLALLLSALQELDHFPLILACAA
jgi:hypothetical protein